MTGQFYDIRGLELTASCQEAVDHYDESITELFEYRASTMKKLKVALEIDPTMPMAICLQGYLFQMIGTRAVRDRVTSALERLQEQKEKLNHRESLHLSAFECWYMGDELGSSSKWYEILSHYPLDMLAMKLLHSTSFWMGNSAFLHDSVAGAFMAWEKETPGYGFVLGMYAFSLEESGEYGRAEEAGLEAIEMNRDDLWALHAVAHVYEMQSRLREGVALLDMPRDSLDDRNPFRGHVWWHAAMFALDLGEYDRVFQIYDESIRSIESTFYLDVQNTASLLARLQMHGVDVGDRWEELADIAEQQIGDHALAFTEMHYSMSLANDRRDAGIESHLDSLEEFAKQQNHWSAGVMARTGMTLCGAVVDHARGNYQSFLESVLPMRHNMQEIGGSHAQRDVFHQMLLDSAIKTGQFQLANSLVSERISRRPDNPDNWRWYGEIQQQLGNRDEGEFALNRARDLLA